jgi:PAS domain S-box-containing protein
MEDLLRGKEAAAVEADFVTKEGRRVPVEGSARCRLENGRPVATRGIFRDVSRRKSVEAERDRLFNLSLDLLCVAGVDGYFKEVNPAFELLLGYSREELLSRSYVEFMHPDDREASLEQVRRLSRGELVVDFENRFRARDDSYRWLTWRAAPEPERGLIYAIGRDITEQKRLDILLRHQADELERSNSALEQFAYVASHDLRTPLRAIGNLAEWIEEDVPGGLPGKVREYLGEMRSRVHRMETLIDDLLNYARAGRASTQFEEVDTGRLIHDLIFLLSPPEGMKIAVAPDMPVFVTARAPLEQVFRNLVANAIRHHDRKDGSIQVSARDAGDAFEFAVEDDGPGIPERFHAKIFEMFQQVRSRDAAGGSGLGLALVKRTVEAHGGEVSLRPQAGRGARFTFTWPKVPESMRKDDADHSDR